MDIEAANNILRKNKCRITTVRKEFLYLISKVDHFKVRELVTYAYDLDITISDCSIYNNINFFTDLGFISVKEIISDENTKHLTTIYESHIRNN